MKACFKVGICGHFGKDKSFLDGQTVKTKMIYQILSEKMGSVDFVDTYEWKQKIFKFITNCFLLIRKSENIILLPAQNGVKIFIPFFWFLNLFFKRKIHYVVIGGWLPEYLKPRKRLCFFLRKIDGIYVETHTMQSKLEALQFKNVFYMPNCKELHILTESELVYNTAEPYRVCTFSRVMKEKGIEDAVEAVKLINEKHDKTVYILDIYGQVDENYKERFKVLEKEFPEYIQYKGMVPYDNSVAVLKNYFLLLFPTYYDGEGFAGTLLDAFAAGLPVIATNWRYNGEIITDKQNGFLYETEQKERLRELLAECYQHPQKINDMREACLKCADAYSPDKVIKILIENLQK